MSLFTSGRSRRKHKGPTDHIPDYDYMHWTKQLEFYPLRDRKRWEYEQGDSSTYFDMDRDPNITIKEITE